MLIKYEINYKMYGLYSSSSPLIFPETKSSSNTKLHKQILVKINL